MDNLSPNFIENLMAPIAILDSNLSVLYCNPSFQSAIDKRLDIGSKIHDALHFSPQFEKRVQDSLLTMAQFKSEAFLKVQDTEMIPVEIKVFFMNDSSESIVFELIPSVEKQVQETMGRIGQVLSEMTHSLSNPISVIQVNIDMAMAPNPEVKIDEKLFGRLDKIKRATERVVLNLKELKQIARAITESDSEAIQASLNPTETI